MSTTNDPFRALMMQIVHCLKVTLDRGLSFKIIGQTNGGDYQTRLVVVKSYHLAGDVLTLKLGVDKNGYMFCEIINANGLSQIHPTARNKTFLHEIKEEMRRRNTPQNGGQKVGKQGYVSASAKPQ